MTDNDTTEEKIKPDNQPFPNESDKMKKEVKPEKAGTAPLEDPGHEEKNLPCGKSEFINFW